MRTAEVSSPLAALTFTCALILTGTPVSTSIEQAPGVEELWIEPADLEKRDLFRGPGDGPAPDPNTPFTFVKVDSSGNSPGYDVRSADGTLWSVKIGEEAQSEVAASRILWAIGFHQPPTYYLAKWTMTGQDAGPKPGARFRPERESAKVVGDWKWIENPFVKSHQLAGLLVAQMFLNNWDLKSSNNKVYEITSEGGRQRRYVVRDLGASLGGNEQERLAQFFALRASQGKKNDIDEFEESRFIEKVESGLVKFAYRGPNEALVAHIMPAHVNWTAQLLSRLSDAQWQDAFRAAGYPPDVAGRYIAKLKERVAQGLALK